MARIKFTALVESIRGSIAGTTFQRNAYGFTVKAKPNMVNPNKSLQLLRRSRWARQASKWKLLTDTERSSWQSYAESFPRPTRLNPSAYLNGFNYFVMWHGFYALYDPNGLLNTPTTTQTTVTSSVAEIANVAGVVSVAWAFVVSGGSWKMFLYLTGSIPLGQEYVKVTPKFITSLNPSSGSSQVITSTLIDLFGTLPSTGDWLGIRLVCINQNNGQVVEIPITQTEVI